MKHLAVFAIAVCLAIGPADIAYPQDNREAQQREQERQQQQQRERQEQERREHERQERERHEQEWRDQQQRDRERWEHERQEREQRYQEDRRREEELRSQHEHHNWRRGDHLPRAYFAREYVIDNYGAYHLRRPPRGHCWIRVDDKFLLAAIATGVVVEILSDEGY